jgi:hypothetical protein
MVSVTVMHYHLAGASAGCGVCLKPSKVFTQQAPPRAGFFLVNRTRLVCRRDCRRGMLCDKRDAVAL